MEQVPNIANKNRREIVQIRGINYTNSIQDGDIADCKNISVDKYPYITTAKEKTKMTGTGYENVKSIASNRFLMTFADDKLYIDGNEHISDIPSNRKRTAISTGKMLVLPDEELISLDGQYTLSASTSAGYVSSLGKLIAQFNNNRIYFLGSNVFISDIAQVTPSELNNIKYQKTNTQEYYQMSEDGVIYNNAGEEIASVKKGDVVRAYWNTSSLVYYGYNYYYGNPTSVTCDDANTGAYTPGNNTYFLKLTDSGTVTLGGNSIEVTADDIVVVVKINSDYRVVKKLEAITVETLNDKNGGYYWKANTNDAHYRDSSSLDYYYFKLANGGTVKKPSRNGNTWNETNIVGMQAGQFFYIQYYKSYAYGYAYTKTSCEVLANISPIIDVTSDTDNWLYISPKGQHLIIPDLKAWGVHFPKSVKAGHLTLGISGGTRKYLTGETSQYVGEQTIGNTTYKVYCPKITSFAQGDTITIDNGYYYYSNNNNIPGTVTGTVSAITNATAAHEGQATTGMNVSGFPDSTHALEENRWYSFKHMESPDFACEWGNRLWCCNSDAKLIFASEQGKPDKFFTNAGEAGGSYSVTLGDVDAFTGMSKFESSILFFKQNRIYKIIGSSPKNYELFSYETEGVKSGCDKSLCTINGILYYVGIHGVYAYSGGMPVLISSRLGDMEMNNAVGGTDGERYYLSFESGGKNYMFTFEPKYNIWMLKGNIKALDFARSGEDLYYLDASDNRVYKVDTDETADNTDWHIQFTPFYETIAGKKRYTKLLIRYELGEKSYMTVKIRQDGKLWQEVGKLTAHDKSGVESFILPIMRCDKFELRIEGKGKCTIREISREFEIGSDVK